MQAYRERHLKNYEINSVSAQYSDFCEYENPNVLKHSMNMKMKKHKILTDSINQHTEINKHHMRSTVPRIY